MQVMLVIHSAVMWQYGLKCFPCSASDVQCPTLCSIRWPCRWLCHVSIMATQHPQGFLRPSSVAFSRCLTLLPDWYIDLLGMSMSHRCCKTFTGCGLQNALISTWLRSFTDACMVSFRLHPVRRRLQPPVSLVVIILAASDPMYMAVHRQRSCVSGGWIQ